MTEQEKQERILLSRKLINWDSQPFDSDQKLLKPQPPLVKAPMTDNLMKLPMNFEDLEKENDLVKILYARRSQRVYTQQPISLLQFSFLLWAQQGIKGIRGNNYATLRTVPSAGGRHPFEIYALVLNVEGLKPGVYHYVPMEDSIELLKEVDPSDEAFMAQVKATVRGQAFACKASVLFYYSITQYRGEWRYGFNSHRVMMMDAGHVTQNLYISCAALGLGGCAIGALESSLCNELVGLDGEDEYCFYAMPVGTVSSENEADEQAFYAWLNDKK